MSVKNNTNITYDLKIIFFYSLQFKDEFGRRLFKFSQLIEKYPITELQQTFCIILNWNKTCMLNCKAKLKSWLCVKVQTNQILWSMLVWLEDIIFGVTTNSWMLNLNAIVNIRQFGNIKQFYYPLTFPFLGKWTLSGALRNLKYLIT